MKSVSALMMAMAVAGASARQMHAGINYERYLQEADSISSELDEWMSKFQDDAEIHGWLPQTEARSADEVYEDRKQRYFMSKELVEQLSKENPDAEFDVATSPFSLMTTDEFATYVKNAYLAGDHGRQLRARPSVDVDGAPASSGQEGNGRAHTFDFRKWWGNMWGNKNNNNGGNSNSQDSDVSASDSDSVIISSDGFTFQDLINWFNNQNKNNNNNGGNNGGNNRQPNNGPRPAGTPRTRAPVVAPTDAPATYSPVTRSPTTRAPVVAPTDAPTSRPNPRTPSPVNPVGPVAPADTPSGPTPTPIPTNAGETGADGNGMNWAKNKCMPPVQNQGQCGSCWAFATVAATETGKCIATKATTFTKLSEQNVATCDTRNMGCNGGATSYAMSYIQQSGVCTASDVPYTMGSGRQASCNSGCSKVASGIKSTSRVSGESGLVSALNKAPVVIAVAAGNAAWKQYRSGVLSTCQTTQVDHAVLAVGYDDSSIIIRNSWGPSWGEAGYIRMKRGGGSTGTCSMYRDMLQPQF